MRSMPTERPAARSALLAAAPGVAEAEAAGELVARAEGADEGRLSGVADQPVIFGVAVNAPAPAELGDQPGGAADGVDSAVGSPDGEPGPARLRGSHSEPGALVAAVRHRHSRADREEPLVAVAGDIIGAEIADPPVMAAEALSALAADPEALAELILGEGAHLDRVSDLVHRRSDVLRGSAALVVELGADPQAAALDQTDSE